MLTVNLKFKDKEEAVTYLLSKGWKESESAIYKDGCDCVIGLNVTKKTGVTITDKDGYEYEESLLVDGYHVNLLVRESDFGFYHGENLKVNSPSFKWAGF